MTNHHHLSHKNLSFGIYLSVSSIMDEDGHKVLSFEGIPLICLILVVLLVHISKYFKLELICCKGLCLCFNMELLEHIDVEITMLHYLLYTQEYMLVMIECTSGWLN